MVTIHSFIIVLALVLLVLAAVNIPSPPRVNYGWAGVALLAAAYLFAGFK